MIDFCYFVHVLLSVLLFKPSLVAPWISEEELFAVVWIFANGYCLFGVPIWSNAIVPNDLDRLTRLVPSETPLFSQTQLLPAHLACSCCVLACCEESRVVCRGGCAACRVEQRDSNGLPLDHLLLAAWSPQPPWRE